MVWFIALLWTAAIMLCVAPGATLKVAGVFAGLCVGSYLLLAGLMNALVYF